MERKEMVRYIVVFIALMFIISMFYNFTRTPTSHETISNISQGKATATCKIAGYGNEIIIQPWNENTQKIASELKNAGYIDYINIVGNKGVLVYSSKLNIEKIRNAYINEDVDILAQSSCTINGLVSFYLQNGSETKQAPGNIRLYLDPFSRVGEEIDVDLVAYISDKGIESISAEPITRTADGIVTASFACYDLYAIVGKIRWEDRNLNMDEIIELGINSSDINYTKNDAITFNRDLNQTEINEFNSKLNEKGINATVYTKGIITDSFDRQKIESIASDYNLSLTFSDSYLILFSNNANKNKVEEFINKHGSVFKVQKACLLITEKIGERSDGTPIYIPEKLRRMQYYIDLNSIPENNTGNLNVKFELMGMTAQYMEFVSVR
ncbi:MAG: hypothetical protein QXK21_00775 [Candidatus Micrarchaeia archaeon]